MQQTSDSTENRPRPAERRIPTRAWWLVAAAVAFTVSTAVAWTQSLRPDPFVTPAVTDGAWWYWPLERNGFRRLPVIVGHLNAIVAAPDTELLWAVGDTALIVHSPDGGRTWHRQDIGASAEEPRPPASRRSSMPRLVAQAEAVDPPAATVAVPSVVGRTVGEATSLLAKNELTSAYSELKGRPAPRDIVVAQSPRGGTRVPRGTTVHLRVEPAGAGAEPKRTPVAPGGPTRLPAQAPAPPPGDSAPGPAQTSAPPGESKPVRPQAPAVPPAGSTSVPAPAPAQPPARSTPVPPPAPAPPPERPALAAVHFVDARRGWVVGEAGTVLATADGGQRWERRASGTTAFLRSVRFVGDGRRGWAVGDGGVILATSDGGTTWRRQSSGTQAALSAVHVDGDGQRGWIAGSDGTVLATTAGGTQWRRQDTGTRALLRSIHVLADGRRGWVVGREGTILATSDGGARWEPQSSERTEHLSSIAFAPDGRRGWAAGESGVLLETTDGGARWSRRESGTTASLTSTHVLADRGRGWVAGGEGTVLVTDAAGRWGRLTAGRRAVLSDVHVDPDGRRAWVSAGDGMVLVTTDGGRSWRARETGTLSSLGGIFFLPDGRHGWAIASHGVVLATTNGGVTWQPRPTGTTARLSSVQFLADARRGWVAAVDGTILTTADGGTTWQSERSGMRLLRVRVDRAGERGWAVGLQGTILARSGPGRWDRQPSGTRADLVDLHVAPDGQRLWAVGDGGRIVATATAGTSWTVQPSGTTVPLLGVHFLPDARRGWAVGWDGTILTTADAGGRWERQASATSVPLLAVRFDDRGQHGWIAGWGTMLLTADGGRTWHPVQHAAWPAPWYYASWLVVLALLLPALKRPAPQPAPHRSVADLLVSDRPLELGEPDALGFGNVARGLSRFLRNEQTRPPLTVAITGAWGSGKSSLMNLLRGDLRHRGFRPVWFNAWHHQKEEHLLAALLQNIRAQAVPAWFTWSGLVFRARLLSYRSGRRWRLVLPLLALGSAAAGYFSADHPSRLETVLARVDGVVERLVAVVTPLFPEGVTRALDRAKEALRDAGLGRGSAPEAIPTAIALVVVLVMVWRGIKAFGVSPADLMASVSGRFRRRTFEAKVGFRHDFAREFCDVTRALNPRTMLILIDDLDRCRPENVLEVLEAVNFLVSSGDCFVVMGMELDRVRRCVGLGFKDVAEELTDAEEDRGGAAVGAESDEGKRRRAVFAQQYLEKLINIEVPVPVPTERQAARVIAPEPAVDEASPWPPVPDDVRRLGRILAPVAALLVMVAGGFWGAASWWPPAVPSAPTRVITAVAVPAPVAPVPLAEEPESIAPTRMPAVLVDADAAVPSPWMASWPLALLALGAVVMFLSRPPIVVKDSHEFAAALEAWHPLVFARHSTPRSAKRFVNRVRYYAMRQRDVPEERRLDRLAGWLARWRRSRPAEPAGAAAPGTPPDVIPERVLVALSAIEDAHEEWLKEDRLYKDPEGFLGQHRLPPAVRNALREGALGPELARYREAFERLSAGVRT
jgi:photosystem II stability/assembly factor-like uncharacterized protein